MAAAKVRILDLMLSPPEKQESGFTKATRDALQPVDSLSNIPASL
jgi:hypothetical protein